MRRGVGIHGLQHAVKARVRVADTFCLVAHSGVLNLKYLAFIAQEQFKNVGDEVKQSNLQAMKDQMSLFRAKLEEFALKHKNDIRRDPEFRAKFHTMCANIGVDPLASNKVGMGGGWIS